MILKSRILVADEEPTFLNSIAYVLKQEGFLVSTACDGEAVLAHLQEKKPALIVLSATLPHSLDLPVCCAVAQSLGPDSLIPMLLWGTDSGLEERIDTLDCGVAVYLQKPFAMREFIAHVHALLHN